MQFSSLASSPLSLFSHLNSMASQQFNNHDSPLQCANGCGFFGRPETYNLCSKCYKSVQLEELKRHASVPVTSTSTDPAAIAASLLGGLKLDEGSNDQGKEKDQCSCCNKRIGLVKGFRCRCGNMYCTKHRYPEEHRCGFDYKAAGRDLLAKCNPVVKADKLERV